MKAEQVMRIAGGWRGRPIAGGGTLSEIEGLNQ